MEQSDSIGVPGTRVTLVAEVRLPLDVHVYAPGAKGYKPIKLEMDAMPEMKFPPMVYPQPNTLFLPVINEKVPVFAGTFRIRQDVKVSTSAEFWGSLGNEGKTFTITGTLDYQACDKTTCYIPASILVKWQLHILPLDRTRAPVEIRHK